MLDRVQAGERNGIFGIWVSKPGIDVKTALPGQFLLDTNSQIYQSILTGDTALRVTGNGVATPAGSYDQAVALPLGFPGNLYVQAVFYAVSNSGVYFSPQDISTGNLKYVASSGVLTLRLVFSATQPTTSGDPITYRAAWAIFRAQF